MEKSFEKFCIRVKREREAVSARSRYSDWIVAGSIRWASELSVAEVADGLGITKDSINRWKRLYAGGSAPQNTLACEDVGMPAVLNLTRISVAGSPEEGRVLARLVRGEVTIEFFDECALVRSLGGVLE
jgi:hypothetical protein